MKFSCTERPANVTTGVVTVLLVLCRVIKEAKSKRGERREREKNQLTEGGLRGKRRR